MIKNTMSINHGLCVSLTSTSQNLNPASKTDLVLVSTQDPYVSSAPRIPGFGEEYVEYVAADFDAPIEWQQPNELQQPNA
jgi:hypothetical protein